MKEVLKLKKTIICNIPMKENLDRIIYQSDDASLPVAEREVSYPICAFLEKTMHKEDELKIILLVKNDSLAFSQRNVEAFKQEFESANKNIGATATYTIIDTAFEETRSVHEKLMGSIVDKLEIGSHILTDITYGPKDLPIVVFTALAFAEKFLHCSADNIIYGQAHFSDGHVVSAKICDMIPLYCLSSVTNLIRGGDPEKAKTMLHALLSL